MKLAHELIVGGHLGARKTTDRLKRQFPLARSHELCNPFLQKLRYCQPVVPQVAAVILLYQIPFCTSYLYMVFLLLGLSPYTFPELFQCWVIMLSFLQYLCTNIGYVTLGYYQRLHSLPLALSCALVVTDTTSYEFTYWSGSTNP